MTSSCTQIITSDRLLHSPADSENGLDNVFHYPQLDESIQAYLRNFLDLQTGLNLAATCKQQWVHHGLKTYESVLMRNVCIPQHGLSKIPTVLGVHCYVKPNSSDIRLIIKINSSIKILQIPVRADRKFCVRLAEQDYSLVGLVGMDFSKCNFDLPAMLSLCENHFCFHGVESLSFRHVQTLTPEMIGSISRIFPRVTHIDFSQSNVNDKMIESLVERIQKFGVFSRLVSINLVNCYELTHQSFGYLLDIKQLKIEFAGYYPKINFESESLKSFFDERQYHIDCLRVCHQSCSDLLYRLGCDDLGSAEAMHKIFQEAMPFFFAQVILNYRYKTGAPLLFLIMDLVVTGALATTKQFDWLVTKGVDIHARNYRGENALLFLLKISHQYPERCLDLAKKLIAAGVDPCDASNDGKTALGFAKERNLQSVIQLFSNASKLPAIAGS